MDKRIMTGMLKKGQVVAKDIMKDHNKTVALVTEVENLAEQESDTLGEYWQAIIVLCDLVKDYINKQYLAIPVTTIVLVIASFVFVVSPFRLLPKWFPLGSFIERIFVLVFVLEFIKEDLEKYNTWKASENA